MSYLAILFRDLAVKISTLVAAKPLVALPVCASLAGTRTFNAVNISTATKQDFAPAVPANNLQIEKIACSVGGACNVILYSKSGVTYTAISGPFNFTGAGSFAIDMELIPIVLAAGLTFAIGIDQAIALGGLLVMSEVSP